MTDILDKTIREVMAESLTKGTPVSEILVKDETGDKVLVVIAYGAEPADHLVDLINDAIVPGVELSMRPIIDAYFKFRGLKEPSAEEALLFLLSEVGELCKAWEDEHQNTLHPLEKNVVEDMKFLGEKADELVSIRGGWTRNNGRKGPSDLDGEFGDVLMMLDRFAGALGKDVLGELLFAKMLKKGFLYER